MSTNSDPIIEQLVHELRADVESLIDFVQAASPEGAPTAYEMEGIVLKRLLALGRRLLTLYFTRQAARHRPVVATDAQGRTLPYFGEKRRSLLTLFGRVPLSRSYYWAGRGAGTFPLDAALNLPTRRVSDRLSEWREVLGVDQTYHAVGGLLREFLGVATSSRSVQAEILEDAEAVEGFYAQAEAPTPEPDATLLVVQADGKGVPMVLPPASERSIRLGKGEKAGRKKEAVVTAVYTLSPRVRTPEEVIQSLFDIKRKSKAAPKASPARPVHKRLWATLNGKTAALAFTAKQAEKQDGAQIVQRIALTDGSGPLQDRVREAFPEAQLVLDFIHVDEYLWKVSNALLGETAPERTAWVRDRALSLLQGQTSAVIGEFRTLAADPKRTQVQRAVLTQVAAYYERNQAWMEYDRYLACGWPMATGVIEGACRHLVKDRCERSGMRWTQEGAEALLRLRSVFENGDWERFHAFRREKRHREVYRVTPPNAVLAIRELDRPDLPQTLRLAA